MVEKVMLFENVIKNKQPSSRVGCRYHLFYSYFFHAQPIPESRSEPNVTRVILYSLSSLCRSTLLKTISHLCVLKLRKGVWIL